MSPVQDNNPPETNSGADSASKASGAGGAAPQKHALPDKWSPCPICGKPAVASFQPFCSARCTDVDLNRWFKGAYAIPGKPVTEEEED